MGITKTFKQHQLNKNLSKYKHYHSPGIIKETVSYKKANLKDNVFKFDKKHQKTIQKFKNILDAMSCEEESKCTEEDYPYLNKRVYQNGGFHYTDSSSEEEDEQEDEQKLDQLLGFYKLDFKARRKELKKKFLGIEYSPVDSTQWINQKREVLEKKLQKELSRASHTGRKRLFKKFSGRNIPAESLLKRENNSRFLEDIREECSFFEMGISCGYPSTSEDDEISKNC